MATELPPITVTADPGTGDQGTTSPGSGDVVPSTGNNPGQTPSGSLVEVPLTQTAGVQKTYGQSLFYLITISSSVHGMVQAWLPDDIMFNVTSNWGPIVSQITDPLANFGIGAASRLANEGPSSLQSQFLSNQAWRGSGPMTLQLPLHFFAETDSNLEVIEPIKRLMKMALPRSGGSLNSLIPPGPFAFSDFLESIGKTIQSFKDYFGIGAHLFGEPGKADHIAVYIGNYCRIQDVFISHLSAIKFAAKLSPEGYPMEGTVVLNVSTLMAPTNLNIDDYFGLNHGYVPKNN
jgi:hypothetical protein